MCINSIRLDHLHGETWPFKHKHSYTAQVLWIPACIHSTKHYQTHTNVNILEKKAWLVYSLLSYHCFHCCSKPVWLCSSKINAATIYKRIQSLSLSANESLAAHLAFIVQFHGCYHQSMWPLGLIAAAKRPFGLCPGVSMLLSCTHCSVLGSRMLLEQAH